MDASKEPTPLKSRIRWPFWKSLGSKSLRNDNLAEASVSRLCISSGPTVLSSMSSWLRYGWAQALRSCIIKFDRLVAFIALAVTDCFWPACWMPPTRFLISSALDLNGADRKV